MANREVPTKSPKYNGGSGFRCGKSGLTGSGKMSSAHGNGSGNPTKGMRHAEGRLGASCRSFKSNLSSTTGGQTGGPKHASQPQGHKSKA